MRKLLYGMMAVVVWFGSAGTAWAGVYLAGMPAFLPETSKVPLYLSELRGVPVPTSEAGPALVLAAGAAVRVHPVFGSDPGSERTRYLRRLAELERKDA